MRATTLSPDLSPDPCVEVRPDDVPPARTSARAVLVALRPRQWTKNLLLFAGIVFAAQTGDAVRWALALVAFAAWCAASSAAYLLNDVRDAAADRLHPVKRFRPIARGELVPRAALGLAAVLAVAALLVAAALGPASLACLVAFLALQAAYTTVLKRIVIVDVLAIAGLFVLRAAAGAIAVDVRVSPWLLACTALLALFLGLGKRRAELAAVAALPTGDRGTTRASLARYDPDMLDRLLVVVAAVTIATYTAYALLSHETPALVTTVPLVALGVLRYLALVRGGRSGEEPENVLLQDRAILGLVGGWALACAAILAVWG